MHRNLDGPLLSPGPGDTVAYPGEVATPHYIVFGQLRDKALKVVNKIINLVNKSSDRNLSCRLDR